MDETFTVYRFNTMLDPDLNWFTPYGKNAKKRLSVGCECASTGHSLSSGQAKQCAECGLLMSRVGNVVTLAKVS